MDTMTYKESLSELDTISKKIELYVNNNASVPKKLRNDFAATVIDVIDRFTTDIGQEKLDMVYASIDRYYDTLENKVADDIGPLSPMKRVLLIQGYTAIRKKLEAYAASNYLDEQIYDSIMDVSNFLKKSCSVEYCKTDCYRQKDFDYTSYFYNTRNSSIDVAKETYAEAIGNLLSSTSDNEFYHYLELCVSAGAALDAIILLG